MWKLPVNLKLGTSNREFADELHIYSNFGGVLISWKEKPWHTTRLLSRSLDLLSSTPYLQTQPSPCSPKTLLLTVFDGMIRAMDGKQFHIHLSSSAKPFCVTSLGSISFAYCDKLAAKLQLQHIIPQLLNILIGVLPLWSPLRRIVTHSHVRGLVTLELLCETKKVSVPLPRWSHSWHGSK